MPAAPATEQAAKKAMLPSQITSDVVGEKDFCSARTRTAALRLDVAEALLAFATLKPQHLTNPLHSMSSIIRRFLLTMLLLGGSAPETQMRCPAEVRSILRQVVIAFVILAPPARAQTGGPTTALAGRPANIPAEYVVTPAGWFHPSCVIEVSEDQKIDANENIALRSDGSLVRALSPCQYPRYDGQGNQFMAGDPSSPFFGDWVVAGGGLVGQPMSYIAAIWTVPMDPPSISSQILYFFPGLTPNVTQAVLLQPVLAWNQDGAGWTIASWRWSSNSNNIMHSAFFPVTTGSQISGFVEGTNCDTSTGVCANWLVLTQSGI